MVASPTVGDGSTDDGIFTRVYLTEIDEDGHASPPVKLPDLEDTMMCYNVPEFLRYRVPIDGDDLFEAIDFPKEAGPRTLALPR